MTPGDAEEIITRFTEMMASLKRKLTEESVAYIKHYLLQGMSVKDLAQRYGVGTTTIGKIRDGELWAKVRPHASGNLQ